jgi:hypothetical protein
MGCMTETTEKSPRKQRGKPRGKPFPKGQSGNPAGKPKGARHATTLAMEAMLAGDSEKLTRKAIDLALEGDTTALRLCMDRVLPARKDRPIVFDLPKLGAAGDVVKATAALLEGVACGQITPSEAGELSKLVEGCARAMDLHDIERRLDKLEAAQEGKR